jgi:hypothetical protein
MVYGVGVVVGVSTIGAQGMAVEVNVALATSLSSTNWMWALIPGKRVSVASIQAATAASVKFAKGTKPSAAGSAKLVV